ncbi:MAG: C40 family peptidase [Armatimonadetes bacterium]|nr:C40 family peptidase [Armatimonadota bacterium]
MSVFFLFSGRDRLPRTALCLLALLLATPLLDARSVRPRFDNRAALRAPLKGEVALRVIADRPGLPIETILELRADSRTLATFNRIPFEMAWDTLSVPDGPCTLYLVILNTRTDRETVAEEIRVAIDNGRPARIPTRETASVPALPADVGMARQEAQSAPEPAPLSGEATALHISGGRLYIGRSDGRLTIYNPARRMAVTVQPPQSGGPVVSIATGAGVIWWLADSPAALYAYREPERRITAYSLGSGENALPAGRIAWWQGRIALTGRGPARLLDPKTGEIAGLEAIVPPEIAGSATGAPVQLEEEAGRSLLSVLSAANGGPAIQVWQGSQGRWILLGSFPVLEDTVALSLTPRALAAFGRSGVTTISLSGEIGAAAFHPFPASAFLAPTGAEPAMSGSDLWWIAGGMICHLDLKGKRMAALIPWNEKGLTPLRAVSGAGGAWVATTLGVRRIALDSPHPRQGYGGFVRLPLGEEAARPPGPAEEKMAAVIQGWQGVPYLWGGSTKQGTDCSGFVSSVYREMGVSLPHGSQLIGTVKSGKVVRDELRYGDVLVFPGHCAIYIGDGRTAETVRTPAMRGVGASSIWGRRDVIVRRFLKPSALLLSSDRRTAERGERR